MPHIDSEGAGDDAVDEELVRAVRQRRGAADRGEAAVAEEQPQVRAHPAASEPEVSGLSPEAAPTGSAVEAARRRGARPREPGADAGAPLAQLPLRPLPLARVCDHQGAPATGGHERWVQFLTTDPDSMKLLSCTGGLSFPFVFLEDFPPEDPT